MTDQNNFPKYSIENDPLFKPISDNKKKIIDKSVEDKIKSLSLDEIVDKDDQKLSGQNYALISIVSPQSGQKKENICIKIKGVFNTVEEANKHAEILQKIDATFDIFVVEMYSWLLVPPDPNLMEQKHVDSKLNEIIGGHRESQLKSKMYFEERKKELLENINIENEKIQEENKRIKEEEEEKEGEGKEGEGKEGEGKEGEGKEEIENIPSGIQAESTYNISNNGNNCPNSATPTEETVTPSELMEKMINTNSNNTSRSWADVD